MDPDLTTFAVTDVETTGRSPERNRITEIAVVRVCRGEIVEERSTLVNPGQYISREIQDLTGITNGMVGSAPTGQQAFPEIRSWFNPSDIFTAHNVQFDLRFVQAALRREGLAPLASESLCTLRLARRLLPARRGFSLGKLASYLGIRIDSRHRALGDARATARVLIQLIEIARDLHDCTDHSELISLQFRPTTAFRDVPKRLEGLSESVRAFPSGPGVYRMVGRGGKVLYVGKAKNLRDRVSSYFRASGGHSRKNTEMVGRVRSVEFEQTPSELSAILLESKLIKTLQPKYNVAGKRIRKYAFVRIDRTSPWPRPEVSVRIEADGAEYFGPFRNRDEAGTLVETLQKIYPLRECDGEIMPARSNVPCLYHSIGRCLGPCADLVTEGDYAATVSSVVSLLNGSEEGISSVIRSRMERAAQNLEFELAAELRDRLVEVERVFVWRQQIAESVNRNNLVVIVPESTEGRAQVYVLLHGTLFVETAIRSRFPRKRIENVVERAVRRLGDPPDLGDPLKVDEIRLVAGYLRRSSENRHVLPIGPESLVSTVVDEIESVLRRRQQ